MKGSFIMTVRVNAHHIICPGCLEKVFVDELVGGHCPLCGCVMEEDEGVQEFEEVIERSDLAWIVFHYFVFRKFDALGVTPVQIMQLISQIEECGNTYPNPQKMEYHLEVPMGKTERFLPKRCAHCGSFFIRGGKKIIIGNLNQQGYRSEYHCPSC
jgi:hypothetical protein